MLICGTNECTGLRGLGRHTKRGGSFLVAAISGATVFTPATGAVMDASNASIAMVVPLVGYLMAWVYPLYINVWNKELMDSHRTTTVGLDGGVGDGEKAAQLEAAHDEGAREKGQVAAEVK